MILSYRGDKGVKRCPLHHRGHCGREGWLHSGKEATSEGQAQSVSSVHCLASVLSILSGQEKPLPVRPWTPPSPGVHEGPAGRLAVSRQFQQPALPLFSCSSPQVLGWLKPEEETLPAAAQ
ncbi:hypothetical protein SRHO_G00259070 [Serrasalmus rhombeus]